MIIKVVLLALRISVMLIKMMEITMMIIAIMIKNKDDNNYDGYN